MKKTTRIFLAGIILVHYGSLFGIPRDARFNHLNLHCKALAQSMTENCKNKKEKAELVNMFEKFCDDGEFISFATSDKNWPLYKNAFLYLFPVLPIGMKHCLNDEAVARFRSEGVDLLKMVVYSFGEEDNSDLENATACFFDISERFYEGNVNTLLKSDGEKRETIIDCLESVISERVGEAKLRTESLRDILIEMGVG